MSENKFYNSLNEEACQKTKYNKSTDVYGQSFIVDWKYFPEYKNKFNELSLGLKEIFGDCFQNQENHHSTILSKELPYTDIVNDQLRLKMHRSSWLDSDYKLLDRFLSLYLNDGFSLTFKSIESSSAGTTQIVLINERAIPYMRIFLKGLGAMIKEGTIDGNRLFTCTVVLGHFIDFKRITEKAKNNASLYLNQWIINNRKFDYSVNTISLVEYYDLSLNRYNEIKIFSSQKNL